VQGLGISEKWANLLPYVHGHIGAVAAVVELLLVPRTEGRTPLSCRAGIGAASGHFDSGWRFWFLTMNLVGTIWLGIVWKRHRQSF